MIAMYLINNVYIFSIHFSILYTFHTAHTILRKTASNHLIVWKNYLLLSIISLRISLNNLSLILSENNVVNFAPYSVSFIKHESFFFSQNSL